jgi:hypothetical protein
MFLSVTAVAASSGFPARARADQFGVSIEGLTFLVDSTSCFAFNRFLLSSRHMPGLLRICCHPQREGD